MSTIYDKTPDGQLKVVHTKTEEITASYTMDGLLAQRDAIQAQWDRDNAQRQQELDIVNQLIAEAEKLGVGNVVSGAEIKS